MASLAQQLKNKSAAEAAQITSRAIVAVLTLGTKTSKDLSIEILEIKEIDKGVQVLARAFKNGKQLGFGKDKDVDIERFKIYNPPYKVDDGTYREVVDVNGETILVPNRKEDPAQALLENLAHTISVTGKESGGIVAGKIGHTVSTFNPDANAESTSVDGYTQFFSDNGSWAAARSAATGTDAGDTNTVSYGGAEQLGAAGPDFILNRAFFLFDTSALPDTDEISSAVLSIYDGNNANSNADSISYHIVSSSPASNTAITTADHDQVGSTSFASKALSTFSNNTFQDFTLDANGIANISKTGISKFGLLSSLDLNNTAPTTSPTSISRFDITYADSASNDPKLVVTHAAAASGPANLKTYNTNALANIKSIHTNLIANVKTLNTNA